MRRNKKGFSLMELMVVIIIIGVMATLVLSNFEYMRLRQKEQVAADNLEILTEAVRLHMARTGETNPNNLPIGLNSVEAINEEFHVAIIPAENMSYVCNNYFTKAGIGTFHCAAFFDDGNNDTRWALVSQVARTINDGKVYCYSGVYSGDDTSYVDLACPSCKDEDYAITPGPGCPWNVPEGE